ncbi:hypothetical protein, partial [Streptomyces antibioticus]|uniref:hypothetical protein n=1 Tax=Streptomyces antibioticus TaxID=1890 RepID=UPI0033D360C7
SAVTPRSKARTLTTAAVLSLTAALTTIPWGTPYTIPGITSAIACWWTAAGYRQQHRDELARHEQARRDALTLPDPQPTPDPEQAAEQAAIDETFADMISHWNEDA